MIGANFSTEFIGKYCMVFGSVVTCICWTFERSHLKLLRSVLLMLYDKYWYVNYLLNIIGALSLAPEYMP